MKQKTFNWGIIGPGRIAERFAGGLLAVDDAVLYGVASRNETRAQEFAAKFDGKNIYTSYETMVNDPNIDGVYIATPHRFHYEQTMLCLDAGKPVLCEKPLTVNAVETQALIEKAKINKVFLMEALWTRYLPIYDQIREWLDSTVIGDVKFLISTFGFALPSDPEDRWLNPELAGGTLLDMGVYPIAISQWVTGMEPKTVSSQAIIGETGVDLLTSATFQYENGIVSQFSSNFITQNLNDFTIYGTKGSIRIHPFFWDCTKATLTTSGQELTIEKPFRATGFEYQAEEAMHCIREGLLESPKMTHADTLANMKLMDSIRENIGLKYPFE